MSFLMMPVFMIFCFRLT